MYAKEKGFTKTTFKGLQEPPLNPSVLNGKIFTLVAPRSYGLSEKMPVYYKDIKVGTIRRVILQKKEVKVIISINRKYQNYINDTTRFWNIRGIDVSFDKSSLKLQIPGISQLLIGGIGFDTLDFNAKLTKKTFFLYSSRNDAYQNRLGNNRKYITMVMIVNNDKNGLLKVGNPVMFKNFKIGYIEYMHSYLNLKNLDIISICYLKIDEGAFNGKKGIIKALKKGLSAEIEITNPIFDSVAVNLVFRGKGKINYFNNNLVLPVVKSKPSQIISNIKKLIKKLASVDYKGAVDSVKLFFKQNSPKLKSVLENLSKVLKSTNTLLDNNQTKQIPENINKTIIDFDKAVKAYGPNSLFFIKFNQTLKDADETFKVLEKVGKKIDEKPNSLIFGD
jgi:paraquat-inducible protein B